MAVNYTRVNWDTTKYVNPTNMNQMDKGIKDCADGVTKNETDITEINTNLSKYIPYANDVNYLAQSVTNYTSNKDQVVYIFLWNNSSTSGNVNIKVNNKSLPGVYAPQQYMGYPIMIHVRNGDVITGAHSSASGSVLMHVIGV